MPLPPTLSIAQRATLSCLWEVSSPKVGNVHRGADFEDLTFHDFVTSAVAIGPAMELAAAGGSLGHVVFGAVRATREAVGTNTNLGSVLLLAPLAMAPQSEPLATGVSKVLASLTPQDAYDVYAAIRLAHPGGLGRAEEHDVAGPAPGDLLAAMRLAAPRDRVARQYAEGFADVLDVVAPWLQEEVAAGRGLPEAIVRLQLRLLSRWPDSLIARKCGDTVAKEASHRAAAVLESAGWGEDAFAGAIADFDFWLRSDGHRRNPGTTADLIAAGIFACLLEGTIGEVAD